MTGRRTQPRKRGEGQWGLGYFEPLNPAERAKRDDDGLHVRARIESNYAKQGFRSIDKTDIRSRLRWWGLYTQRKQGIPGGATGTVEPHELEDEFFMMRIRISGGQLTSDQLRAFAWASERFGRDVADVTDRQKVQLHWIRIEDVPRIWERLEATGSERIVIRDESITHPHRSARLRGEVRRGDRSPGVDGWVVRGAHRMVGIRDVPRVQERADHDHLAAGPHAAREVQSHGGLGDDPPRVGTGAVCGSLRVLRISRSTPAPFDQLGAGRGRLPRKPGVEKAESPAISRPADRTPDLPLDLQR